MSSLTFLSNTWADAKASVWITNTDALLSQYRPYKPLDTEGWIDRAKNEARLFWADSRPEKVAGLVDYYLSKIIAASRYYQLFLPHVGWLKINSKTEQLRRGRSIKPVLDELLHEVAIAVCHKKEKCIPP